MKFYCSVFFWCEREIELERRERLRTLTNISSVDTAVLKMVYFLAVHVLIFW